VRSYACLSGAAGQRVLALTTLRSIWCVDHGVVASRLQSEPFVRSLRQCGGGFSVCVRPELALRLAQLGDDGQLLLTTATGQLLVWILECLALAPPAAAAVLPAAFKPAAGRPGDQRVLRSATADSWGRLEGRWPLEWSQELHCSCYAHSCQTALRAGGFTLDYGGSGGQQLRFKLDGRPNPQPQPLLATSTCPAWWCAAAAACSARART